MAGFEGAPLRRGGCPWMNRGAGGWDVVCCWGLPSPGVAAVANRRILAGAAWWRTGAENAVEACRRLSVTRRDFMLRLCQEEPVDKTVGLAQKEGGSIVASSEPQRPPRDCPCGGKELVMSTGRPVPAPWVVISNPELQVVHFGVFRHFTCSLGIADKLISLRTVTDWILALGGLRGDVTA